MKNWQNQPQKTNNFGTQPVKLHPKASQYMYVLFPRPFNYGLLLEGELRRLIYTCIFYLKSKMPLQQIADGNHHHGGNDLGQDSIQVNIFYKYFQQEVIDEKIGYKNEEIPEQLHPAADGGINEDHVFI